MVADLLAKKSKNLDTVVWLDDRPNFLVNLLANDVILLDDQ